MVSKTNLRRVATEKDEKTGLCLISLIQSTDVTMPDNAMEVKFNFSIDDSP